MKVNMVPGGTLPSFTGFGVKGPLYTQAFCMAGLHVLLQMDTGPSQPSPQHGQAKN